MCLFNVQDGQMLFVSKVGSVWLLDYEFVLSEVFPTFPTE